MFKNSITRARKLGLGAALVSGAGSVLAAVPADVTTAVTDMKTDGMAVAVAVLVAIIAVMAIKFIRKGF